MQTFAAKVSRKTKPETRNISTPTAQLFHVTDFHMAGSTDGRKREWSKLSASECDFDRFHRRHQVKGISVTMDTNIIKPRGET